MATNTMATVAPAGGRARRPHPPLLRTKSQGIRKLQKTQSCASMEDNYLGVVDVLSVCSQLWCSLSVLLSLHIVSVIVLFFSCLLSLYVSLCFFFIDIIFIFPLPPTVFFSLWFCCVVIMGCNRQKIRYRVDFDCLFAVHVIKKLDSGQFGDCNGGEYS